MAPARRHAPAAGEAAPGFTLSDQHGQRIALSELRARGPVLLVFYPWAFSGICGGELAGLQQRLGDFETAGVAVVTVSVDSMFAQRAWADREGFTFTMLADFWPHGEVARAYGIFDEKAGAALRGTFLVDGSGVVRWSVVHGIGKARDIDDCLEAIAAL